MTVTSTMKRITSAALAFVLAIACIPAFVTPARAADIASGTSNTCSWTIDASGTLTIAPTHGASGLLEDYARDDAPWLEHRDAIKAVRVQPGVKANGGLVGIFSRCANLTSVDLSGLDASTAVDLSNMF